MDSIEGTKTAAKFLVEYRDPEINRRLHFDVWFDRAGLDERDKLVVWREVTRAVRREGALRKGAGRRRCAAVDSVLHEQGANAVETVQAARFEGRRNLPRISGPLGKEMMR